jgi:hypothetical protein
LLRTHGGTGIVGYFREIVDAVEDSVNRLGDIIVHIIEFHFFGFYLLRSNFAISIE